MHRLDGVSWHIHKAHVTWAQAAGETVRTARSARGNTGTRAGPNGETGGLTRQLDPRVGPLHRETACVARGGTQGGLNCLTHVLPRCLPTPTEEADGNGYGAITGRGGPSRPPPRASVNLVPLLLRPAFDSIRQGGPTRNSADASVPRFAGFSLIT